MIDRTRLQDTAAAAVDVVPLGAATALAAATVLAASTALVAATALAALPKKYRLHLLHLIMEQDQFSNAYYLGQPIIYIDLINFRVYWCFLNTEAGTMFLIEFNIIPIVVRFG